MSPDYLYFDEQPTRCPGCGKSDHPAPDGPSYLMIMWTPTASSYLCIDCRYHWSSWTTRQVPGYEAPGDNGKPAVVQNLERIANGEAPLYVTA